MTSFYSRLALRRRVHREDEGFTLIEMMVALAVLFIVMSSVVYTATRAFTYIGVARQRETAMSFAVKYYQQALALPFAQVKNGLYPTLDSTYSTDANIVTDSATCKTHGVNSPCMKVPNATTYENLYVTTAPAGTPCSGGSQVIPLCPHVWTDTLTAGSGSGTTYTTKVYVTAPANTTCNTLSCYRLVVQSSWNRTIDSGASSTVTYQSIMTNTSGGCATVTTASHPYAGPCPTYLYGQALIPQGAITITGNTAGGTSISGINLGSAAFALPQDSATLQSSQVSTVQGVATTSSLALSLGTSTATTVGGGYLSAQADNDPTLPAVTSSSSNTIPAPDAGSVSAIAGASTTGSTSATSCGSTSVNAICLTKAATDTTGSTTANTAGNTSSSCASLSGGVPCGTSTSQVASGTGCTGMSSCVVLHLFNGSTDLGTCTLVSVGAPGTAGKVQVSQNTTSTPQPVTSTVTRSFGQISLGCIPSNVATVPTGWNVTPTGFTPVGVTNTGFLAGIKTGYSQTLQAQAGLASPTTSATLSGTEWYYSPGTTTQTGGSLSGSLATTSTTLSAGGTLNAAVANTTNTVGGTIAVNIPNTTSSWSARGTLAAAVGNTTDTVSSIGTLPNAITTTSATTFNVSETSSPALPFEIKIDNEKMWVTARTTFANGNHSPCNNNIPCYTVQRGYNGTTAATHSAGATVNKVTTDGCPSSCTFTVTETSAPPTGTPFTILVDSEQMTVTSRTLVSGSTYTYVATRAVNSTTAASHASGATVSYNVAGCPSPCSFNVTETSAPPSGTPFTIQVDSEQMSVTSRTLVSGSTYTYVATRAVNSTTAASHTSGTSFTYISTTCPSTCNFDVNESAAPPSGTPFTIQIDGEQMQVTARAKYFPSGAPSGCINSNSLWCYSVTRAYNSTTATSHAANATVSYVIGGCPSPCSFNVTETTSPPATPFTILVDSEQMQVTSRTLVSGSTYTYTATRAYNSTTAVSHATGTTVYYLSVPYGYTTQTDSSASAATSMLPTSVNYTTGGCTYQESLSGTLASPTGSVANTSTSGLVTNSNGSMSAPLTADFKFKVTCGATTIADLDIAIGLGAMKAVSTYSPKAADA